ncbi:hypothetical protein [Demequina activiva]|uniref:Uncharacterized protein n=1 Tax=Demequina activiva TaxID=1582364 RepID=A0A919UJF2_9MICO|nr:hypothetical protein [Demequina activiva]GIG54311.1 hypothetical protein Dac01nite_10630 [Demequina activiva]
MSDEDFDVPDDLSGLADATPMGESGRHVEQDTVALFTPIQNGRVLAAVCALNGVKGQAIETSAGAFAVLDDTTAGAVDTAGEVISAFVKTQPILAMERRAGQITIHRWQGGAKGDKLPPGLALDQAPGVITTLMAGTQTIDEIAATHPGKVFEARMSRVSAFRELRKASKEAKKRYKAMEANKRDSDPDPGGSAS